MPEYQFHLFGAPRLEHREQPVPIDTRKALALLAYLLLNGEPQQRDTLATLLWPESSQKSARAALRRTLSTLRSALDEQLLDFGREIIAIHPGSDLWCDVLTFRSLLAGIHEHGHPLDQVCMRCLNPLQQAAQLYTDDFMAGFSLRDSVAFDDWQFFEADRFRRELSSVLERLVSIYMKRGEIQTAIEIARRWLTLDVINEAAHRTLILLYAKNGQRNAALRQYRECVRLLNQELGVPPLEETKLLYESVKENRLDDLNFISHLPGFAGQPQLETDQPSSGKNPPISAEETPLIGRTSEWEILSHLYSAIDQDGVFAAISGEIGVGKSHLAQTFITHQQSRGAQVISARCFSGESNLAYTPLIDLLRKGIDQAGDAAWWKDLNPHWLSEISLLQPDLFDVIPDLPPPADTRDIGAQNRFYEAVCQVLTALVRGSSPGILFIDDLEWVDQSTLDLLAYFTRRLKSRPVFILAAWRTQSSSTTAHLDQMLIDSIQQGYGVHLPLPLLQSEQAHELIDRVAPVDQQFSDSFIDHLIEVSGGLPVMLLEYLQAVLNGEISRQQAVDDWPLPMGLRGLLENRLAGLSGSALQILQAAAVLGRTFDIELLQPASGRTEEEIIQGIEELLAQNLVQEIGGRKDSFISSIHYDFNLQQVRDLVLEDLSLVRLRLLHRRTAEALEEQQRITKLSSLDGQIAYHYQQAGSSEKAAEYYFRAGQEDCHIHANADALNHFQASLALGYPNELEILMQLGDLYILKGDYPSAVQNFEAAAAYEDPEILPSIEQKIGQVYLRLGEWEQAACHFEAALFDLSNLPPNQAKSFAARVHADLSLTYHRRGQSAQAASQAKQAMEFAKTADDPLAMAQTQNLLGILARSNQQYETAVKHLEDSLSYTQQSKYLTGQVAALNNLALARADLGERQAAMDTILQAIEQSRVLGDRHLEAALRSNYADILRADGQLEPAMQQLKIAASIFAEIGQNIEDWQPEIWKLVEW